MLRPGVGGPAAGGHTPPGHRGDHPEYHVEDVAEQIEDLVPTLEEVAGRHASTWTGCKEVVGLSRTCRDLWKAVLETAAAVPSPLTFFDGTIQMGPAVVARGTREAVDYYRAPAGRSSRQRVQDGVAAVEGERLRIYWEGMPIWGKLRDLCRTSSAAPKTCVVASTYCNSWIFDALDPADPFRSMARAYTELFICRDEGYKEEYIEQMVRRFRFDGILFHDAKTCPNNSNSRYGMPQRLARKLGIPGLVINGDLNDLRCYSEEQARPTSRPLWSSWRKDAEKISLSTRLHQKARRGRPLCLPFPGVGRDRTLPLHTLGFGGPGIGLKMNVPDGMRRCRRGCFARSVPSGSLVPIGGEGWGEGE